MLLLEYVHCKYRHVNLMKLVEKTNEQHTSMHVTEVLNGTKSSLFILWKPIELRKLKWVTKR